MKMLPVAHTFSILLVSYLFFWNMDLDDVFMNTLQESATYRVLGRYSGSGRVEHRRLRRCSLNENNLNAEEFRSCFRMSKDCFASLKAELQSCPSYSREFPVGGQGDYNTNVIDPSDRILSALWYLATEDSYRSIGKNFSLDKSSVHEAVTSLCKVVKELGGEYVKWPSEEEQLVEMATFYERTGFPGVIGCVDGTHITFTTTDDEKYNRKKRFSFNIMLTCNSQEEIVHFNIGAPGRMNDSRVFRRSALSSVVEALPEDRHILGDSAYALSMGLMRPYRDTGHLSASQRTFNHILSSTRMIIENAIGRLKGKWRRLKHIYVYSEQRALMIIETCIILHNFLLRHDSVKFKASNGYFYRMPSFISPEAKRDFLSEQIFH